MYFIRFPVSISQTFYLTVLNKVQEIVILRFGPFPAIHFKLYQKSN